MFLVGVASAATFGVFSARGSAAFSGFGLCVGFYLIFYWNNPLLELSKTYSLAPNNYPKLLKKKLFSSVFIPLSNFFNSLVKLLYLLSAFLLMYSFMYIS